jgi:hypothetical protein
MNSCLGIKVSSIPNVLHKRKEKETIISVFFLDEVEREGLGGVLEAYAGVFDGTHRARKVEDLGKG